MGSISESVTLYDGSSVEIIRAKGNSTVSYLTVSVKVVE
jgi:hypothetical protein